MADARRVALLARPGGARERLQAALQDAGAEVVLVVDPTASDAAGVRAAGANAVLVALEPLVEDALDRFDEVLADPAITVIFDEADLAAQREGWDAARWVRHLAAKLGGHADVLPPGAEAAQAPVQTVEDTARDLGLDLDFALEFTADGGDVPLYRHPEVELDLEGFATEATDALGAVPRDTGIDGVTLAAQYEPPAHVAAPAHEEAPVAPFAIEEASDDRVASDRFKRDLEELNLRIASMELVDAPRAAESRTGAVVVYAGIGGPDAVRQLLAALPDAFGRPVLIQQRLDGARHDKLVRQMQRATSMPVHLAELGGMLQRGQVYVLPEELGVVATDESLRFGAAGGDWFSNLPADDSAVILLSGSDPALVEPAMAHALRGALVAGQAPEGCYDAAAPDALVARGAEAGAPAELAKKLAERWPA